MNKTVLIAALALVFASAFVVIGNVAIQSAQACPNTSSGTAAPNVNPNVPNALNTQPPSQLASRQMA
jgi:hypothetical protein